MLAEAVARKMYPEESFESYGTEATRPIFEPVKEIVRENNLEESVRYSPEQVSQNSLEESDRIICMTERHRNSITENFDIDEDKVEVWDIPDADPEDDLEPVFRELERKVREMY